MSAICMFPGQSSLEPSMLAEASTRWPRTTAETLERAERRLGEDLSRHLTEVVPRSNRDVQLTVFLTNHVHMLARAPSDAAASLGLSLGEYNHLVHIGALGFEDAAALVGARGEAYDRGPRGCMAAVFPLPVAELEPILGRARVEGCVTITNYNSPTQSVIGGEERAVEAAIALIEEETFAQVRRLASDIPMHAPIFRSVVAAFRPALEGAPWREPRLPYRPNVGARRLDAPTPADFVEHLARHVCEPVEWQASIDRVVAELPTATLLEIGPGKVLTQLLRRPWTAASRLAVAEEVHPA
ncbi:MAG: ACP S-malonyltransferase [Polyangiaceae bacterium]